MSTKDEMFMKLSKKYLEINKRIGYILGIFLDICKSKQFIDIQ
jgi:hypothetical protein